MFPTIMIFLSAGTAAVPATPPVQFDPRKMTPAEIRAHNQTLARNDPNYIRCVRRAETGSLVRKIASCRTNAQWASADDIGNQNARDTFEDMQGKAMTTSN